jgi:Flp pilus assembly protein TadG
MKKLQQIAFELRNKEEGAAELYSALIVLPIMLILLVSLIDVGGYYVTIGKVSDLTKEASRQVAIYGGSDSTLAINKLGNKTVQDALTEALWDGTSCTQSSCTQAPDVSCTNVNFASGGPQPGDYVNCTVTYYYKSILSSTLTTAAGPLDFGLSSFLNKAKVISQYSVAETWGN